MHQIFFDIFGCSPSWIISVPKRRLFLESCHKLSFFVGQDTDCDESLEEFEEEFGQYAVDPDLIEEWKENLEKAEEEINEQNKKYKSGESTYWDSLNEFSELSQEAFVKAKTGLVPEEGEDRITYATGHIEMPERLSRKISM